MPEQDDAALELRLRNLLVDRLGSLSLELTLEDVERRRLERRRARRRRGLLALGLAAAVLLPAGWLAAGAPVPKPDTSTAVLDVPSPTPAPVPIVRPSGEPGVEASPGVEPDPDVITPAGGHPDLLVVTFNERGRNQPPCDDLDRYSPDTGEHRELLRCADRIAISAGGAKAAVGDPRGIRIVGLVDGSRIGLMDLGEPAYPITWSPSGRWLEWAACGSDSDIRDPCKVAIGSPDSAERHRMPGGEGGGYLCCAYWPPDESLVAVPADAIDAVAVGNPDGSDLGRLAGDDPLASYLRAARSDPGRMSPDGRQFVDVVSRWENGQYTAPELWVAATTGDSRRRLTTLELGARVLGTAWSPDGATIAISKLPDGGESQLWLLDLNGSVRQLTAPDDAQLRAALSAGPGQWSPDGTRLAIGVQRGDPADRRSLSVDTVIVPIDGSAPVVLRDARRANWSPDGASIAFVATTGPFERNERGPVPPATIEVASGDGSNRHLVVDPGDNEFWFMWAP